MPAESRILLLGGTSEANRLAALLAERQPDLSVLLSLAGRTRLPTLPPAVAIRIGGFGGVEGLTAFLENARIETLVDATHPFAQKISRNAAAAAHRVGVRHLVLLRPAWVPQPGDCWTEAAGLSEACDALPPGARPFLALGRQHVAPFLERADLAPLLRMIEPPDFPLPAGAELVLARPSSDWRAEADLMRRHGASVLVCRNSGGRTSYAKVEAARRLSLPVVMIARPPTPNGQIAASPEALLDML